MGGLDKEYKESSKEMTQPSMNPEEASILKRIIRYLMKGYQFFLALLLVLIVRSSLYEPFKIPSGSMIPTLYVGDFIFVNKFAYGFKLPFSDLFGKKIILFNENAPKRGEIIVFLYPEDPSLHYIKRIVGVPGDRVSIEDKVVYVNGEKIEQTELPEELKIKTLKEIGDYRYSDENIRMFKEKLGEKNHLMFTDSSNDYTAHFNEIRVPEGHLFVLGDNRDWSRDSRFWGFVPYENISGRAEVIWLSMWIDFKNFSQSSFKPSRIGTVLE